MSHSINLLIISLLYLNEADFAIAVHKFVYQKDMSEHCRRRVVPSVFLGRHVAEAHSQILHFSRMELPYSCFISVRGESGSNIILVVQLLSDASLIKACSESRNQLLVYEMGETFGGYWGPLPETMMKPLPQPRSNIYTLRTTQTNAQTNDVTTGNVSILKYTSNDTDQNVTTEMQGALEAEGDYIRMEVPIVNVSGGLLVASDEKPSRVFDMDENFDVFYDVTPRSNEKYDTSMLPVVQFSIDKEANNRRSDIEPLYRLQYDIGMFTPDVRLIYPHYSIKTMTKKKYSKKNNRNKIQSFMNNKTPRRNVNGRQTYFTKYLNKLTDSLEHNISSTTPVSYNKSQENDIIHSINTVRNWEQIEYILNKLKGSDINDKKNEMENKRIKDLLETISNVNYNYSVYLSPNLESLDMINFQVKTTIKPNFGFFTRRFMPQITFSTKTIHQFQQTTTNINEISNSVVNKEAIQLNNISDIATNSYKGTVMTKPLEYQNQTASSESEQTQQNIEENIKVFNNTQEKFNGSLGSMDQPIEIIIGPPSTGSMVHRESWENVVQAAPIMVQLLNQTVANKVTIRATVQEQVTTTALRKRRGIQPIPIEIARPHSLSTKEDSATTTMHSFDVSDMQDFMQLVEIQDDELHDRVALRYLRQYVGAALFNICEYNEPKTRHVFLFNSSRIAIAISNFTLERMTMILTPARTLVSAKARCSISSLECQVYGTRVCIDNSNACDGVPNCGAYEVYDEDRLMCGAAIGLQHNVYLAAITFIAVLLTILYIIHYWLKRCVPKVSEAFFMYMDGAENILYLETIMRSPFDVGAGPRAIYRRSLCNNNDDTYLDDTEKFRFNIFFRLWKACFNFVTCKFKSKKDVSSLELNVPDDFYKESKRIYSSTEFELTRISNREVRNTSVQTGDSLEISGNKNEETGTKQKLPNQGKQYSQRVAHHDISFSTEDTVKKHVDELNILKFFKDSKFQDSLELNSQDTVRVSMYSAESHIVEEEIEMHLYDLDNNKRRKQKDKLSEHKTYAIKSSFDAIKSSKEVGPVKQEVSKRHTKHLRFVEEAVAIPNHEEDEILQSPSVIKDKKWQTNEDNVDNDGAIAGASRDFKRFWSGITKKSKKKTQVSLH